MSDIYNVIVIGAGIGGLYCAKKLTQSKYNCLVLERNSRIGGRISTFRFDLNGVKYTYDAGGLRINSKDTNMLHLIKSLSLDKYLVQLSDKKEYRMSTKYDNYDSSELLRQLSMATKNRTIKYKQSNTLSAIGEDLIDNNFVRNFVDCFGYDQSTKIKNYYDFERTYLNEDQTKYFKLDCGMDCVVKLLSDGLNIEYNCHLLDIDYNNKIFSLKTAQGKTFKARKIILAIPKESLLEIPYLSKIKYLLNSVSTNRYMRIYAVYPKNRDGKIWFDDIQSTITETHMRQVIPMDKEKGLIMACYCDDKHADVWLNYTLAGFAKDILNRNLKKLFPDKNIPEPIYFKTHYWEAGTHYWLPNNDSRILYEKILKPFDYPLYICGESYSKKQGWMEGALQTAIDIIKQIKN